MKTPETEFLRVSGCRWIVLLLMVCSVVGFWSLHSWAQRNTFSEPAQQPAAPDVAVENAKYTQIKLAKVGSYVATSGNDLVITSGTVVGIRVMPSYRLVLSDGKGAYMVVSFGRAFTDVFAPTVATLKIGDVVEVMGTAGTAYGVLRSSPNGITIETSNGSLQKASYFGAISLTGIHKLH